MADQTSTIPKDWKMTTLGKVADKIIDNRGKTPPIVNSGFELLEVNAILGNQRTPEYSRVTKFIGEETLNNWFRTGKISENDILIPTVGTIGNVSFSKLSRGAIAQNLIAFRTDRSKAEPLMVYYLLKTPYYKNQLLKLDIGGVQPSIKVPHLLDLEISLPTLLEQKAIAAVLSSLDDKIELLREQNKTLEAAAQVIFKEWFVNFNFRGATGKMIDSKLGKIPEGWRVGKLGDVLSLEYGKPMKEEDRTGEGYPVFGSNGIVGYHKDFLVKGDGIVVGRKGTMGAVVWVENNFYPIDTTFYVRDKLGVDELFFHYLLLLRQNFEKLGSDSAVPGLNRNSAYSIEIIIPKIETIDFFHQIVKSIFSKQKNNNSQIQTLAVLRDVLLPKLMKGDVRVKI